MAIQTPTNRPEQDRPAGRPQRPGTQDLYIVLLVGAAVAVLALLVIVFVTTRGDDTDSDSFELTTTAEPSAATEPPPTDTNQATTTSGTAPSTTDQATASTTAPANATSTTGATSTPTTGSPATPTQAVVWPDPDSGTRFTTPEAAARSFAVDLAGFADPVLGEFQAGDGRSGEIELRPIPTGPVSTILLRQVSSDDSWSVIAVVNENIVITQPAAGEVVANPMVLVGQARAFEGHVDVRLFRHGQTDPIATGFVTGRGDGVLGSFDSTLDWPPATQGPGILVLSTSSAEDGSLWDVAAIPVNFS